MGIFTYVNHRFPDGIHGEQANFNVDDSHEIAGNPPLLAPHGAPANPKWQTKYSSGLTAGIKQESTHSTTPSTSKMVNQRFSFTIR